MRSKESIQAKLDQKRALWTTANAVELCLLAGYIHALEWALEDDE